ncbi:hypothetical protein DFP72DRAFT_883018 [Ephemerocybe angulata]|uniref:HMG box domain-containing protein n=1 Tax=Ephemerocybe angulata TaxID=980116 RepID=A0A8H6I8X5_9AGAR|nr:hypothetical protein DFP72DRAFT_883018 [Tulosesus angulatus]
MSTDMNSQAGPIRNTSPGTHAALAMAKPTSTAPRPPNAWILYRSDKLKEMPPTERGERRAQSEVSQTISQMWRKEKPEIRSQYERLADEKKAEHAIKYPGYRFQPMKKEEKAALRSQKKAEKEAERKARQQRNRQASNSHSQLQMPPLPQQQAQPAPSTSFSLALPVPQQRNLSLYPPMNQGIYYPMDLFGSAGPSPPVSLASSPTPESTPESTSDESYDPRYSQPPPTATAIPTNTPMPPTAAPTATTPASSGTNPYLALLGPAATQSMYLNAQTAQAPTPHAPNVSLPMPMATMVSHPNNITTGSQNDFGGQYPDVTQSYGGDEIPNIYNFEGLSFQPFENQQLSFNVDSNFFGNVSSLLPEDSGCHNNLEAMRVGHDIFALSNFESNTLDAHPEGEVLVDLGQFGQYDEFDYTAYLNHGMLDPGSTSNSSYEQQQQQDNQSHEIPELPQSFFDALQAGLPSGESSPSTASHPSMPPTPAIHQVALSVDLSNAGSDHRSNYAPPPGAAQFAARRVAGSWKPRRFADNEGSFDQPSPLTPIGVSRL